MTRLDVPPTLQRSAYVDDDAHRDSAVWLLAYLAEVLGSPDLGEVDLLDMGCGTKFSQAIINKKLPIGSYHGVDVNADVIAFLHENNPDPRFTYHHLAVHNDLYNPDAPEMTEVEDLGSGDRRFDLITLFSVFTHLAPHDFGTMLKLMRRHVKSDGTLFFTIFIDELTEGGHGLADLYNKKLGGDRDAPSRELRQAVRSIAPFKDIDPKRPLTYAMYSREYALELIEGTGWEIQEVREPIPYAQHHMICRPI